LDHRRGGDLDPDARLRLGRGLVVTVRRSDAVSPGPNIHWLFVLVLFILVDLIFRDRYIVVARRVVRRLELCQLLGGSHTVRVGRGDCALRPWGEERCASCV
jgi:hypothetical protein